MRRLPQKGPREGRVPSAAVAPGSKSHDNLEEAFAGESQANGPYLCFARVTDIEGFPYVAGLFKDTARWRTRHPPSPMGHRTAAS